MNEFAGLTEFLGWMLTINVAILLLATFMQFAGRSAFMPLQKKLLGLGEADFLQLYAAFLSQYKVAVLVLNFAPYCALKIMGL